MKENRKFCSDRMMLEFMGAFERGGWIEVGAGSGSVGGFGGWP